MHADNIIQMQKNGNHHSGVKNIEELASILAKHQTISQYEFVKRDGIEEENGWF